MKKQLKHYFKILFVILIISCSESDDTPEQVLSSEKTIESFTIENVETNVSETDKTINIITEASQTGFLFSPMITISDGATITPPSESEQDFSNPVNYTVTAEDGSQEVYTSNLVQNPGVQNVRLRLERTGLGTLTYTGVIDEASRTITIDFPKSMISLWNYETFIEIDILGDNTSSSPQNNSAIDIDILNEIQIVLSETTTAYSIVFRNTQNNLTCFSLPVIKNFSCAHSAAHVYDEYNTGLEENDLVFFTLENQDVTSIAPDVLGVSSGATITPNISESQDFSNDITYTVISESQNTKTYRVRVAKKKILLSNDWDPRLFNGVSSTDLTFFVRYNSISPVTGVTLVNIDNSDELNCQILQNDYEDPSTETYLLLEFDSQPNAGERYYLRVTLEDGSTINTTCKISISN